MSEYSQSNTDEKFLLLSVTWIFIRTIQKGNVARTCIFLLEDMSVIHRNE